MAIMQMQKVSICALKKRPEGDSGKDSVHGDYGDHPCTGG